MNDQTKGIASLPFSEGLKKELCTYVEYVKNHETAHCVGAIIGCPNVATDMILNALAHDLDRELHITDTKRDPVEKVMDFAAVLTNVQKTELFILLHTEQLKPPPEQVLLEAVTNCRLKLLVGKGASAKLIDIPLLPFKAILFYESKENIPLEFLEAVYPVIDLSRYAADFRKETIRSTLRKFELSATEGAISHLVALPYSDRDLLLRLYEIRNNAFAAGVTELTEDFLASEYKALADVSAVDDMSGRDFEIFAGDLFRDLGFTNVTVTPSSGDFGADVIAEKDDVRYAIQCKRYGGPVGVSAVQEVIAARSLHDCHVACILTNSTYTPAACELAKKNLVILWDREKLKEFIERSKH